jgi:hypothetical protein
MQSSRRIDWLTEHTEAVEQGTFGFQGRRGRGSPWRGVRCACRSRLNTITSNASKRGTARQIRSPSAVSGSSMCATRPARGRGTPPHPRRTHSSVYRACVDLEIGDRRKVRYPGSPSRSGVCATVPLGVGSSVCSLRAHLGPDAVRWNDPEHSRASARVAARCGNVPLSRTGSPRYRRCCFRYFR